MAVVGPRQQTMAVPVVWQPPPTSILKINWDAAVGKKCGRVGVGVIARDCCGRVIVPGTEYYKSDGGRLGNGRIHSSCTRYASWQGDGS